VNIATALERITQGNFAKAKALGGGVSEYKIDFGSGYRIYFGKDGDTLVILLAGGSKKGQSADIKAAKRTGPTTRNVNATASGVATWH
jgi:putative addiction module killer protein